MSAEQIEAVLSPFHEALRQVSPKIALLFKQNVQLREENRRLRENDDSVELRARLKRAEEDLDSIRAIFHPRTSRQTAEAFTFEGGELQESSSSEHGESSSSEQGESSSSEQGEDTGSEKSSSSDGEEEEIPARVIKRTVPKVDTQQGLMLPERPDMVQAIIRKGLENSNYVSSRDIISRMGKNVMTGKRMSEFALHQYFSNAVVPYKKGQKGFRVREMITRKSGTIWMVSDI